MGCMRELEETITATAQHLSVVVEAAITVDTSELISATDGLSMRSRSTAMRFNAVLSSTTYPSHTINDAHPFHRHTVQWSLH